MGIRKKIFITLLIGMIVPVLLIGPALFYQWSGALRDAVFARLHTAAEITEGEIFLYLERFKAMTSDFGSDGFIKDLLEEIGKEGADIDLLGRRLSEHLTNNKKPLDNMLSLIDVLNLQGRVVASTRPGRTGLDRSKEVCFASGKQRECMGNVYSRGI